MSRLVEYKQGLLTGFLIGSSLTYLVTKAYIYNKYTLISKRYILDR